ncbi:membrane-bound PQQ-dependent dehydrogenase, glucose/quinate/shikimate family [Agrobacterium larrymoorei]|uniref:membrane-bound PQQ-dependent dehydrogenase, glucose/quinate/shikimate family n=1 Tax=Agrobacterium larrymoorei TaxID=160699 RepID=UPI001573EF39|nr:membrane-bound PQQ-dependent dehydrogenase, glucose/quinate/shikimate family [Agrobacterium larrymoorei]NTJ42038.1 membrane-bound PQQ-dependent dehydrogenase, glucose/quinate/shikimate family [Agrobacterium larrymoorei]
MSDNLKPLSILSKMWLVLLGAVVVLAGAFFAYFGGKLAMLGGSPYFVISGIALILSGLLIIIRKPLGGILFALVFLGTVGWSLWEVGVDFWPLISRLLAITVGAVFVALAYPLLRRNSGKSPARAASFGAAFVLALAAGAGFVGMFMPHQPVSTTSIAAAVPVTPETEQKNWQHYGNTAGGSRFAALDQITKDNVKNLEVAWTFRTGDVPQSDGGGAEDQQTPIQVGDKVFLCTPHNNVIAVNADTGKELWRNEFNAKQKKWMRCRGLAYFDASQSVEQPSIPVSTPPAPAAVAAGAACERRIIMNSVKAELYALDADTGALCADFGVNGVVDLKAGLGKGADAGQYYPTAAPTLAGTTIVVGGRIADNVSADMPGGVLRGFDVITGQMRWAFDPGSADPNLIPAGDGQFTRSTPNSWTSMSYDAASNTVFIPMGSAAIDLYGVKHTPLDRKYGATMLALDATTGKEKWHYQTVHDDLWDYDIPMQPTLIDFPNKDGSTTPAMVFGTKAGQIFVLDRQTGKPLTKVEERAVKAGTIPGETYSPTQPFSVGMPSIGAETLTEADMWGATPFDQLMCRISFKSKRYDGLFTPPGTDSSLNLPGSLGGMNWGGLSSDPTRQLVFANDMRLGLEVQLIDQSPNAAGGNNGDESAKIKAGSGGVPMEGTPYAINAKERFMSPLGIPCQKPPFGTLTAIDLKTQQVAWQIPVGTVEDTGPLGFTMGLPIPIGMPTIGGSMATQSGLVFFAGTQDYYLRAFDSDTGKELWKARMPVGSQGGPMTYKSPKTGKQYILISAGGARQSPDRGDYVIAYALPEQK